MRRTRLRPLPDGRISPRAALLFPRHRRDRHDLPGRRGQLAHGTTRRAGRCRATSSFTTPLKRISTLCTIVGAVPGVDPAAHGWTRPRTRSPPAADPLRHPLPLAASALHGISWIYPEDYGRAGFAMLSTADAEGPGHGPTGRVSSPSCCSRSPCPSLPRHDGPLYPIHRSRAGAASSPHPSPSTSSERTRPPALFMVSNLYLMPVMTLLVMAPGSALG